jgi:diaminohydroxyphosphoribosylaminopyrimidine deaminase/5-amino-6-(5-phosphoribosylamino)uracil reductase
LVKAGVARVVAAITDLDPRVSGLGLKILERGGISVTEGVCRDQAWQANLGFFLSQTEHRPMFTLKLATDALGNIPGPDAVGEDKWITSPQAQRRGHLLRANHDAVLFGIGTVLSDDPQYTCRLPGLEWTSPVRVLLDSRLRVPIDAKLLHSRDQAPIWIVCGCEAPDRADLEGPNVTLIRAPQPQPDAKWVAQQLAKRGLTRVLIEAGPQVVNSFLAAEVVDEVSWFRSARTLGAGAVPSFHENLWEKLALTRQAVLQAGPDQLELYTKEV